MIDLSTMHPNKKIWVDRISVNLLLTCLNSDDSIKELASKVRDRAYEIEKKTGEPCMKLPARVHEVRKLFPVVSPFYKYLDWSEHP